MILPLLKPLVTILKFYGPFNNNSITSWLSIVAFIIISNINIVIAIISLYYTISTKIFQMKYSGLAIAALCSMCVGNIMLFALKFKSRDLKACLYDMGDFTKIHKPVTVEKLNRHLSLLTMLITAYLIISAIVTIITYAIIHCPENVVSSCGTFLHMELPSNIYYTPVRQIVAIIQVFSGFYAAIFMVNTVLLLCFMFDILTNKIIHLRNMIRRIPKIHSKSVRQKYLIICIKYQQDIFRLFGTLRGIATTFGALLVFTANVIITLSVYMLLHKYDYTCLVHAVCYFAGLVLSSAAGEHIIEQGNKLREDIFYSIPWDDDDLVIKKDMYFMLMRASNLMKIEIIKSAKGISMSMPVTLYNLKMVYSIVSLLLQKND